MEDVLIIGAGAAGLALAYELKQRGLTPRIIDEAHRVAEPWRMRHPQLRLNTSRDLSHLPGLPMPRWFGVLPTRDQFVGYLESYVTFLSLPIEWGVTAHSVHRDGGHWRVETSAGTVSARHVAVATGPARRPTVPSWPGVERFRGRIVHARDFGVAASYAGRKVLVIGSRDSAIDICNWLSRVDCDECWISVRSGTWITPLMQSNGRPSHERLVRVAWLPAPILDRAIAWTSLRSFGRLDRYGYPAPAHGPITQFRAEGASLPTDDGFVAALKSGHISAVPAVESFDETEVVLRGGRQIAPTDVICATGYTADLEPMLGHLGVLDRAGEPLVDADTQPSNTPGLWLFGLRDALVGNMNARRAHARKAADIIGASLR